MPAFHDVGRIDSEWPVIVSNTYTFAGTPPDPVAEFEHVVATVAFEGVRTGVEAASLPLRVADLLRNRGLDLVPVDDVVVRARHRKLPGEVAAVRRACELADVVQQAVKDNALAGITEVELVGLAQAAMYLHAGRRIPAVLTVSAGESTATGGGPATSRELRPGDLVITDTSPWIDGAWSDTANSVTVGPPTREHIRTFDAVRRALELAIALSGPGAIAGDVDRRVRDSLSQWGPTYSHHTGHGIGASWAEPPHLVPNSTEVIEEGMTLALEPAVYRPGWGGIRLEHVVLVRAGGNEILTQFDHTL
jgi:Xaa-Pro aminopeptidase